MAFTMVTLPNTHVILLTTLSFIEHLVYIIEFESLKKRPGLTILQAPDRSIYACLSHKRMLVQNLTHS